MDDNKCTDVACLGLFMLFWVGILGIAAVCVPQGDIKGLSYGSDYLGNRCGTGEFKDRKRIWFPQLSKDLSIQHMLQPWQWSLYGLCVENCPTSTSAPIRDYGSGKEWTPYIDTFRALYYCVPKQSVNASVVHLCMEPTCTELRKPCDGARHGARFAKAWQLRDDYAECGRQTDTTETFTTKQPMANVAMDYILKFASISDTVVGAISSNAMEILLYGAALPTAMGLGWMLFLCAHATRTPAPHAHPHQTHPCARRMEALLPRDPAFRWQLALASFGSGARSPFVRYACSWVAVYLALLVLFLVLLVSFAVCAYKGGVTPPIVNSMVNQSSYWLEAQIESNYDVHLIDNSMLQATPSSYG